MVVLMLTFWQGTVVNGGSVEEPVWIRQLVCVLTRAICLIEMFGDRDPFGSSVIESIQSSVGTVPATGLFVPDEITGPGEPVQSVRRVSSHLVRIFVTVIDRATIENLSVADEVSEGTGERGVLWNLSMSYPCSIHRNNITFPDRQPYRPKFALEIDKNSRFSRLSCRLLLPGLRFNES